MSLRKHCKCWMRLCARWAALMAACLAVLPAHGARFVGAMTDAEWHLDTSVFECKMVHPIERYGAAVFSRRAGEEQRFYLQQMNRELAHGPTELSSHNPLWRQIPGQELLGSIETDDEERPVRLDWRDSKLLMAELEAGNRLVFSAPASYHDEKPVEVVLEPIHFQAALDGYRQCLADLLPANYDQIKRTALYFPEGNDELSARMLALLDKVARYALADERVARIYVDGHTDSAGLRVENLELSQLRAELVGNYLVNRGLPEDLIVVRWHGERYPVASNRTAEGRARNRRVTVRVDREDEHLRASR